jgi:hypothetical protein
MKKFGTLLGFGFLMWLLPFASSFLVFPLKAASRPLFESIMAVIVAATATVLAVLYLRRHQRNFLQEGAWLGLAGFALNVLIDQVMFSRGPMQMSFADYWKDIGLTYLMIPIITCGFGYLLDWRGSQAPKNISSEANTRANPKRQTTV